MTRPRLANHHADLNDDEWSSLSEHLDARQAIELCLLIGHYEMLATTITVLRIQPDATHG